MRWFSIASPTNGVFILIRGGFELTTPALSLHAEPLHSFRESPDNHSDKIVVAAV